MHPVSSPDPEIRAGETPRPPLRADITTAYRRSERDCLLPLAELAGLNDEERAGADRVARKLVTSLRAKACIGGVEGLLHEYALSSQEGVALMCLAEALLRIPDAPTRDALIRDKISTGGWRSHLGHSPSLFVNAATWGLVVTGRLTATASEAGLSSSLTRLILRGGEPLVRKGVDLAMRMLGEHFVAGRTIEEALSNSRAMNDRGFSNSYDMLGEAAMTAEDAARYLAEYEAAIHAIGRASASRGVLEGPGISIKLSALHPRYTRIKRERVMTELLPRVRGLTLHARHFDVGLNIDAEEADRLEISLDILEALAFDPALSGWNGLGFVIQAYGKRCSFVVDWIIDLARRSHRRLMVRLVKGAYWDSEIKRAQADGMSDYPVFTRKVHTDISYLACARKLLAAPDAVFPQFATHNAQTAASVVAMAGPGFHKGQYEFQCLHGMGEPLYEEVVGPDKLNRPCRIYAPVGTHETLLAYLVRRLLENGANSSFVNRIADRSISVDDLVRDPVARARATNPSFAPHAQIVLPRHLYGSSRSNAAGLDLSNENDIAAMTAGIAESAARQWISASALKSGHPRLVVNPANYGDVVGSVWEADAAAIDSAVSAALAAAPGWAAVPPPARAVVLRRAADAIEGRMPILVGLIVREAGKTFGDAISEVREAIDFLRYYASEAERTLDETNIPLGAVACISPWNFPLAIFAGQIAAALAAGNSVLAKPAEETPLIAAEAVRALHAAGIPADTLHLLPGDGQVGAALVADSRIQGVVFTGSTEAARHIQRKLANRLTAAGQPVPLIAETGGLNAMIADSSALAEQVVADVVASAFDSAGQRCSALRILCLQEEIADRILSMLHGATRELEIGDPARLSADVGPVISAEARENIARHIETMRARGFMVEQLPLPDIASAGTFAAPAFIEITRIADVEREVFGPVLHVLRYRRGKLDRLIDDINSSGYGLTFGLHTRIDETIAHALRRIEAGNVYVNRNIIGAIVGVQPFGGTGLSGTGPKAGGPLYLGRLLAAPSKSALKGLSTPKEAHALAREYEAWLRARGHDKAAQRCMDYIAYSALGANAELPGPVGERNLYSLHPRGMVAAMSQSEAGLLAQFGALLATGNIAVVESGNPARLVFKELPATLDAQLVIAGSIDNVDNLRAVLFEGSEAELLALNRRLAARKGPIVQVQSLTWGTPSAAGGYDLGRLLEERSISTNTAAAGGNASLMSL